MKREGRPPLAGSSSDAGRRGPLALLGALVCFASASPVVPAQTIHPRPLDRIAPAYPESLRAARIEGDVLLVFRVDEQGRVFDPEIRFSTHPEFGAAAAEAVLDWRFRPGFRDGKPATFRVNIPITFRLNPEDELSRWAGREVFRPLATEPLPVETLEAWPQPSKWIEPYYPPALRGSGLKGEVVVSFVIDEYGSVINPEVLASENPHFATSALVAAINLRFAPHLNDAGEAVPLQMAVVFRFDEKRQRMLDRVNSRRVIR
jgi:TonB family protein